MRRRDRWMPAATGFCVGPEESCYTCPQDCNVCTSSTGGDAIVEPTHCTKVAYHNGGHILALSRNPSVADLFNSANDLVFFVCRELSSAEKPCATSRAASGLLEAIARNPSLVTLLRDFFVETVSRCRQLSQRERDACFAPQADAALLRALSRNPSLREVLYNAWNAGYQSCLNAL